MTKNAAPWSAASVECAYPAASVTASQVTQVLHVKPWWSVPAIVPVAMVLVTWPTENSYQPHSMTPCHEREPASASRVGPVPIATPWAALITATIVVTVLRASASAMMGIRGNSARLPAPTSVLATVNASTVSASVTLAGMVTTVASPQNALVPPVRPVLAVGMVCATNPLEHAFVNLVGRARIAPRPVSAGLDAELTVFAKTVVATATQVSRAIIAKSRMPALMSAT